MFMLVSRNLIPLGKREVAGYFNNKFLGELGFFFYEGCIIFMIEEVLKVVTCELGVVHGRKEEVVG